MNFFDLPVEIRQSIYNININEKCIILKNENEKNKNKLFNQLNRYVEQYKYDCDIDITEDNIDDYNNFMEWYYYEKMEEYRQKILDEMYGEMHS